ncbi:hypothetical protein NH26_00465 [Flammeovirga pacifica]|uniref:Uncharacterized protein n=2 Tax=Flammeovirga pacifica TaxID=915059 RepID=A0A1S1YV72_FLAPC|nr:hypothetical protein NH26_00465 [Flammeovirga pacifica]
MYQYWYIKRSLQPYLSPFEKRNDGSLSKKDFDKIRKYYGLAVTGILGESLCVLRGKGMTSKERHTSTFQASITGLIDDYFDEYGMTKERMQSFYMNPDTYNAQNDAEQLGLILLKESFKYHPDTNSLVKLMHEVNQAQADSLLQEKGNLTTQQLKNLTLFKGGSSFLYFRSAFHHQITDKEKEALYLLGGITQFSNDIFDVYKDREAAVQTLLTSTRSIREVRLYYNQLIQEFKSKLEGLPYKNVSKRKFFMQYSLMVFSRCFVCLDQLESLEKTTDGAFQLHHYKREELICDMEKIGNLWKSLVYAVTI